MNALSRGLVMMAALAVLAPSMAFAYQYKTAKGKTAALTRQALASKNQIFGGRQVKATQVGEPKMISRGVQEVTWRVTAFKTAQAPLPRITVGGVYLVKTHGPTYGGPNHQINSMSLAEMQLLMQPKAIKRKAVKQAAP